MSKQTYARARQAPGLRRVGQWATVWWGISCAYVLLLIFMSMDTYVKYALQDPDQSFVSNWWRAIDKTYNRSALLTGALGFIVIVWIVGSYAWLRELKRQKVTYKEALVDLFLRIRR